MLKPEPTLEEIVHEALGLRPVQAALEGTEAACVTGLIDCVKMPDGITRRLALVGGKWGAAYIRVSSDSQRHRTAQISSQADGWSEEDQIRRAVEYFVSRGEAFRIYSDAGLSGSLPLRNESMIRDARKKRSRLYSDVIGKVLLTLPDLTDAERESITRHCERKASEIESEDDLLPGFSVEGEEKPLKVQSRGGKTAHFRPALTYLDRDITRIHTIAVTDPSRLSRSATLTSVLMDSLSEVKLVGLIEPFFHVAGDDAIKGLVNSVTAWAAEAKLREVMTGALRGIITLMRSGRPYGPIPFWLSRDETGAAYINPEREATIRRLIDLYHVEGLSAYEVSKRLTEEGREPPGRHGKGSRGGKYVWQLSTVINILSNPNLYGVQEFFGKQWYTLPPIIDKETFDQIALRRSVRGKTHAARPPGEDAYLLSAVLRCSCGYSLYHRKNYNGTVQYYCTCPPEKKKAQRESQGHVTLQADNAECFFHDLIRRRSDLLMPGQGTKDEDRLQQLMDTYAENLATYERLLQKHEAAAREEAATQAEAWGMKPGTPEFTRVVDTLAATRVSPFLEQKRREQEKLRDARERWALVRKEGGLEQIQAGIATWDTLPMPKKNALLRNLLRDARVQGDPENGEGLVLIPRFRGSAIRIPISIKKVPSKNNKGEEIIKYTRRLPAIEDALRASEEPLSEAA